MASQSVFQSNKEKNISRMIDAVKGLEQSIASSYSAPTGQFGRVVKIQTGGLTIDNTLDVEFTVPFDDDTEANEAEIKVYNLKDATIRRMKTDQEISITAGYGKDTGVIFSGVITTIKTRWSGQDKITTITALDSQDLKERDVESISFKAGVKASYVLKTLVSKLGLPIAVFQTKRDHTYTDAVTVSGGLMSAIKQYAEVCGVSAYINKRKVYVRHLTDGDNLGFTVSTDTGLVGSPEEFTEEIDTEDYTDVVNGVKFKMLLEHRVTTAGIIKLKSRDYEGSYRVREGRHVCNESDFYTEVTAIAADAKSGAVASVSKVVDLTVDEVTQFENGRVSKSFGSGRLVGSSHYYGFGAGETPSGFFNLWLRYKITVPKSCKKIEFTAAYNNPHNSASLVAKSPYRYSIGSSSNPASSYTEFKWDTDAKRMNGSVSGDFAAGQTIYLWLHYSYKGNNNTYVDGVNLISVTGRAT